MTTEGFACPNGACQYDRITDAQVHASSGRWQAWAGRADPDVSLPGLSHDLQRAHPHAVVSPKNTLSSGSAGAECASRRAGSFHRRERLWHPACHHHDLLVRAAEHAQSLHERSFCQLGFAHVQVDELRIRRRRATQVLWLWGAIDPRSKSLPVLELGPRTQHLAQFVIHALREQLAPGCLPVFTSDGFTASFYALAAHFGEWLKGDRRRRTRYQWTASSIAC